MSNKRGQFPLDFEELEELPEQKREQLLRDARKHIDASWGPSVLLTAALAITLTFGGIKLGERLAASGFNPGLPNAVFTVPLFIIGGILAVLPWVLISRRRMQRYIWNRLHDRCNGCGYNLTGNKSGRCPECGRDIA